MHAFPADIAPVTFGPPWSGATTGSETADFLLAVSWPAVVEIGIILVEWPVLRLVSGWTWRGSLVVSAAANVASVLVGVGLLASGLLGRVAPSPAPFLLALVLTFLVEWLVIRLLARGSDAGLIRSALFAAAMNLPSYVILVWLYIIGQLL